MNLDGIEDGRLARPREIRSQFIETRAARPAGECLDKPAVGRSTPIVNSLLAQLIVSVVYSVLIVGFVAFIATELT